MSPALEIAESRTMKYKDFAYVPVAIVALGSATDRLEKFLNDIQVGIKPFKMEKIVLLGSARIRRVLDCQGCLLQPAQNPSVVNKH